MTDFKMGRGLDFTVDDIKFSGTVDISVGDMKKIAADGQINGEFVFREEPQRWVFVLRPQLELPLDGPA